MDDWLKIPHGRKASRTGRLCVLMAVTILLIVSTPVLWAAI